MVSVKHQRETDHMLKLGRTLISLDLCILKTESDDDWFQDRHRQEIVALLQDAVSQKVDDFYAKKRARRLGRSDGSKTKPLPVKPTMLQGNTVKICYKFSRRPVAQRCLRIKPRLESVYLFPEKLNVYACQYQPSTVLHTTAQLLHTACSDLAPPPAAVSGYFPPAAGSSAAGGGATATVTTATVTTATNSAIRKRNKLRRIVSRQRIAEQHKKDANSTDSDSWCPSRDPLAVRETSASKGEGAACSVTLPTSGRPPGHAGNSGGVEEAGRGACSQQSVDGSAPGKRQRARTREERGDCTSDEPSPSKGREGSEPAKKRKRGKEWSDNGDFAFCEDAANGSPCRKTKEPVKRQRTGDAATPQKAARGRITGNAAAARLRERGCGLFTNEDRAVARDRDMKEDDNATAEKDAVAGTDTVNGQDAVAMEDDTVSKKEDTGGRDEAVARETPDCEIVDEPECEVFSDGDVDCLDRLPLDRECMSMLSSLHLKRLVVKNKPYLKKIFVGKQSCKRHSEYKLGGSSRANLMYEACYGPFSEDQVECVMTELAKVYCAHHNKYLDYVSKVLLPEALTKICMDVLRVSAEEARDVMETTTPCGDSTILGRRFQLAEGKTGRH